MTKYTFANTRQTHTPQHKTHHLRSPGRPTEHHHQIKKINSKSPSQSNSYHTRASLHDSDIRTIRDAKYLAVLHIQNLIKTYDYDVNAYCMMLELLKQLEFQGLSETSLKVAITVFHIGSKFFDSKAPRTTDLVNWSGGKVTRSEIVDCQDQITTGLGFWLPIHNDLTLQQVQILCYQLEQQLFLVSQ